VGDGWNVALTTLGFERDHSDGKGDTGVKPGGNWEQLLATARAYGRDTDPAIRSALTKAYIRMRIEKFVSARAADMRAAGAAPGPEGSLGKLLWTEGMTQMANDVSLILGPHLVADTGSDMGFAWGEHVLGAPGYRIAGGSDEVQRNIIGERVLGLPTEPRMDKGAWKDTLR
jgi:alkylation response protein AidB-like acyl-CoA dehydrogenase